MDITTDNMIEMIERTLQENPDKDLHEVEMIAYDEQNPKYPSVVVARYKYLTYFAVALKISSQENTRNS